LLSILARLTCQLSHAPFSICDEFAFLRAFP
jgi:hypothetical protein